MKRLSCIFLLTVVLGAAGYRAWRNHADAILALEAFSPAAPAPERWKSSPARASALLIERWSGTADEPEQLACLRALAFLARAREPRAFGRLVAAVQDPSPGVRRAALLGLAFVFQPGLDSDAIAGIDWTSLCRQVKDAEQAREPEIRLAALYALRCISQGELSALRSAGTTDPVTSNEIVDALAAAISGPPVFPRLEERWPVFLAQLFHIVPLRDEAAERFVQVLRSALARPEPRSSAVLEAMFEKIQQLPVAQAEEAILAALGSPTLAAQALAIARRRPSPAYLPGFLHLLAEPGTVDRAAVVEQIIALSRRQDDGAAGDAVTVLLRAQGCADALPVFLHAIHEILGPEALETCCPENLGELPPATAAPVAELLGRTSHLPFLERLADAVRSHAGEPLRIAALDAIRRLAHTHQRAAATFAALLEELADAEGALPVPSPLLVRRLLELNRADLVSAVVRVIDREPDAMRRADLLNLRRPSRLRRSLQEALAPVLAEYAVKGNSQRLRECARASLERFEFPPEAATFATRLGQASRSEREEAGRDLLRVGTEDPHATAERLTRLLAETDGGKLTCQLLRALTRLPPNEEALQRAGSLLAVQNTYTNWRAAMLLLRHDRLFDPSLVYEVFRTYVTSPLPGESYPGILRETIALLRREDLAMSSVPDVLVRLLRQGSAEEVEEAGETLVLIASREAADRAREVVGERVPARAWAEAARVLAEIGERRDLALLSRCARPLIDRYGPEDLDTALQSFVDAAGQIAHPEDAPVLVSALDAGLPAGTLTQIFALLETLTGERFTGDLKQVRRQWRESRWAK